MGASASFLDAEESYEPIRVGQRKRVVLFDKTLAAVDVNLDLLTSARTLDFVSGLVCRHMPAD